MPRTLASVFGLVSKIGGNVHKLAVKANQLTSVSLETSTLVNYRRYLVQRQSYPPRQNTSTFERSIPPTVNTQVIFPQFLKDDSSAGVNFWVAVASEFRLTLPFIGPSPARMWTNEPESTNSEGALTRPPQLEW